MYFDHIPHLPQIFPSAPHFPTHSISCSPFEPKKITKNVQKKQKQLVKRSLTKTRQEIHGFCFVLVNCFLGTESVLSGVDVPSDTPLEQTNYPFSSRY